MFFRACVLLVIALMSPELRARGVDNALDLQRLDTELKGIMATKQMPALAFGMVLQGSPLLTRALGNTEVGGTQPINAQTRFRLASVSKTISAALIGKFVHQGFLEWQSPVTLLVPNFRLRDPNSAFMTVEQLMSHRTGLPHHTLDDEMEASVSIAPIRSLLPLAESNCAIGACFSYQNLTYSFAEDISYAASGQFFSTALQREIFNPIGMTRANVGLDALMEDENWAPPHRRVWPKLVKQEVKPNYYWLTASAGINASISDMQQFAIAMIGYKKDGLPQEVIEKITSEQISTPGEIIAPPWRKARLRSAGYGLGIRRFDYMGHLVLVHAGAVAGYRAMLVVVPSKQAGFVMLWNSESNLPAGLVPTILDRWFNLPARDWLELHRYYPKPAVRVSTRRRR
jgi:beta-lactamase class C